MTSCHVPTLAFRNSSDESHIVADKRSNCIMMIYDEQTYGEKTQWADVRWKWSIPLSLTAW